MSGTHDPRARREACRSSASCAPHDLAARAGSEAEFAGPALSAHGCNACRFSMSHHLVVDRDSGILRASGVGTGCAVLLGMNDATTQKPETTGHIAHCYTCGMNGINTVATTEAPEIECSEDGDFYKTGAVYPSCESCAAVTAEATTETGR